MARNRKFPVLARARALSSSKWQCPGEATTSWPLAGVEDGLIELDVTGDHLFGSHAVLKNGGGAGTAIFIPQGRIGDERFEGLSELSGVARLDQQTGLLMLN